MMILSNGIHDGSTSEHITQGQGKIFQHALHFKTYISKSKILKNMQDLHTLFLLGCSIKVPAI